ncbi:Peptide ABC transporter permease [Pseudomonas syringae pv. delphinii]|uniref:Peptide ABC transporter permease n=1 Tax=Pseudomonas syringae pv. delphinii TaxID=192088 RepID=A0A0P9Q397_9PSED|nr:Peptide ABC transporter permease [Pseudomonas syringae pv. delphinii]RMP10108.1 Peptide ABC transporter permease [Pseudomonas syringae pv. delphinii]RMQ27585.1 Peptide ABC transporter permease [Pseudomonas syringae pv. delphinii]
MSSTSCCCWPVAKPTTPSAPKCTATCRLWSARTAASASLCSSATSTAWTSASRAIPATRWAASWATCSASRSGWTRKCNAEPSRRMQMNSNTLWLIVQRLGAAIVTLLIVSIVVFAITAVLPGDAAQQALGQFATPEQVAALRIKLGLDQPGVVRYLHWLMNLLGGNFGESVSNAMPVSELIAGRFPKTLMLAATTALVSVPVALTLGIGAAMGRGGRLDGALNFITLSLVAVPEFLVATLAVLIFAVNLGWLSALSYGSDVTSPWQFMRTYALPVMTLCCVIVAQMARMTRAAVIDQLDSPYVEMARLKGVSPVRIVLRHALPNAIGPIVNAVALSLSYLLGGVVIVETIFNYPGIASLMVDAVTNRDMALVQGCTMLFCAAYLGLVLMADLCAILSNPRLRTQ